MSGDHSQRPHTKDTKKEKLTKGGRGKNEGEYFDEGFRADLFVDGKVIVELKSTEKIADIQNN